MTALSSKRTAHWFIDFIQFSRWPWVTDPDPWAMLSLSMGQIHNTSEIPKLRMIFICKTFWEECRRQPLLIFPWHFRSFISNSDISVRLFSIKMNYLVRLESSLRIKIWFSPGSSSPIYTLTRKTPSVTDFFTVGLFLFYNQLHCRLYKNNQF